MVQNTRQSVESFTKRFLNIEEIGLVTWTAFDPDSQPNESERLVNVTEKQTANHGPQDSSDANKNAWMQSYATYLDQDIFSHTAGPDHRNEDGTRLAESAQEPWSSGIADTATANTADTYLDPALGMPQSEQRNDLVLPQTSQLVSEDLNSSFLDYMLLGEQSWADFMNNDVFSFEGYDLNTV